MKTTSSNFNTSHANDVRKPVLIIEIANVTRKYCSGTFANISANHKKYITSFSMKPTSSKIPLNNIDFGRVTFEVLDKDLDVATQIQANFLDEKTVTVKLGYQDLSDTDFVSFDNWKIETIQPGSEKLSWLFVCRDASKLAATELGFRQSTQLDGDVADTDTTITVDGVSAFVDPANLPSVIKEILRPCLLFGDNMENARGYAGVSGSDFTGVATNNDQTNNELVRQGLQYFGTTGRPPALEIILFTLLTTKDGSGGYYDLTSYDDNFSGFGVGLTSDEVDIEAFEAMDNLIWSSVVSYPYGTHTGGLHALVVKPGTNALEFITGILNSCGCYLWSDDGKVSVKTFDPVVFRSTFSAVKTFTDDDVESFDYEIEWDPINTIKIKHAESGIFNEHEETYQIDDAVTAYGTNKKDFAIETQLSVSSDTADDNFFDYFLYARKWLYVFSNPFAEATFSSLKDFIYEAGDNVAFTLPNEVDLTTTPSRGWTSKPGIITAGPRVTVKENGDFNVEYDVFILDIIAGLTGYTTEKTLIETGDMDDATLDPNTSSGDSDAIESNDAYYELGTPEELHSYLVTITWDNPDTAAGEENFFSLSLRAQYDIGSVPANALQTIMHPRVKYTTDNDETMTRQFYVVDRYLSTLDGLTPTDIERIKIDAFNIRRVTGSAPSAPDEPQNMTVVSILPINFNKQISKVLP